MKLFAASRIRRLHVVWPRHRTSAQVQIKTTKISNNFYTLEGSGGMIGVLVGPDGVFMVDTQFAPLTDKIVAAIKAITPAPIKFVVNTHQHPRSHGRQ